MRRAVTFLCLACSVGAGGVAGSGPLLDKALSGPMKEVREVVFANRHSYDDGHWYASIGYYCNDAKPAYPGNGKPGVGRLCKLNTLTGRATVLLDAQGGSIRDPVVSYDADRILFSWRRQGSPFFNLHEIGVDGSGLRPITSGAFDDIEPTYLPDGDIAFVSTRCNRWVNCWKTQVAILYRCGPNGEGIRPISANIEHDNTPSMLPDGRLLYTRWEYIDRSQVGYHALWTMNPDGSGQMTFYGNQRHSPLYIEAMAIPGSRNVAALYSPGHGRRDHAGFISVIDARYGPDDQRGVRRVYKKAVTDSFPLSDNLFLATQGKRILLVNGKGQAETIHTSDRRCYEPRPIIARPREKILSRRTDPAKANGLFVLSDVYAGRNMAGVERGVIRKLLILETLPKPVNFSGGPDLTSWLGTFTLERVLGTVPVAPDGSACFKVPANRPVFFVALDSDDLAVKRMQSFVSVMPGENVGCVGCHEPRTQTPDFAAPGFVAAPQRVPDTIQPFAGLPDVLDFNRDIQPVLNRHCVGCHNYDKRAGGVVLEGDLGPRWSLSFFTLFARNQVADGRNGYGSQPPRTIGSSASPLIRRISGGHSDVKLDPREWRTVWLWVESAAPYAGSYAGLRNGRESKMSGVATRVLRQRRPVLKRRCAPCHDGAALPKVPFNPPPHPNKRGITRPTARHERLVIPNDPLARFGANVILNVSRPSLSPLLLAPLAKPAGGWGSCGDVFQNKKDPDYGKLLESLTKSKRELDTLPRYGTPGFQPNPQYLREMRKYGILSAALDPGTSRLDHFALDQKYWESFWWRPVR